MEKIKRTIDETGVATSRKNDLLFMFTQLAAINGMRDKLVHHGRGFVAEFRNGILVGRGLIQNVGRVVPDKVFRYEVDVATIDSMSADALRIIVALKKHRIRAGDVKADGFISALKDSGDTATWLYKSPQPKQTTERSPVSLQNRSRPPRSSPE